MLPKYDLSVVIPVFNVENYIEETLNSILNQSTTFTYEIIVIDDGSEDKTVEIIEKMNVENLKIIKQANKGAGAARNVGIMSAKGEFIYFCDSDDILERDLFEDALKIMKKNNLDVFLFSASIFFDTEKRNFTPTYERPIVDLTTGKSIMKHLVLSDQYTDSPCLYVSKLNHLKENDIKFPEGYMHEDNYFTYFNILSAKRIISRNTSYYKRRVRDNSVMTINNKEYYVKSWMKVNQKVLNDMAVYIRLDSKTEEFLLKKLYTRLVYLYYSLDKDTQKKYIEEFNKLDKKYSDFLINKDKNYIKYKRILKAKLKKFLRYENGREKSLKK